MKNTKQMVERLKWYVGKHIDFDGAYGAQCMDLAVDFMWWATGGKYRMWGNAIDAVNDRVNNYGKYATVHKNTKNFLPKVGDIAVWTQAPAHPVYGHIGIVYGDISLESCTMLDQNWYGDPTQNAILRKEYYAGVTHFIRINFEGNEVKNQSAKAPVKGHPNKWKKNKHGTWYMPERYTFTVGNQEIHARRKGPFLSNPSPGTVKPGTTINYDEIMLQDGLVWIGYTLYDGTREYLPIREWNGVPPTRQGVGMLWGSIT